MLICLWQNLITCWFFRHLKRRHPDVHKAYEQQRISSSSDHAQTSMSSFVVSPEGKTYVSIHPRQKSLTTSLVSNLTINCGLPLSIVDNPHFRAFVSDLDPKYVVPCRQTVSSGILPSILKAMKDKLLGYLDTCKHVALTADIWTDCRAHAFLGVTVHSFKAGAVASHLLAFQSFHGSHMGQRIADAIETVIADNHLQSMRFVITDNDSNMVKATSICLTLVMSFLWMI